MLVLFRQKVCFHPAEPAQAAQEPAAANPPLVLDYFPIPAEKLPTQEQHGYKKT
jgi:hypothetical protein